MKLITKTGSGYQAETTIHSGFYYLIVLTVVLLIALLMWGCPRYAVWQQEMSGKAEFAKAEQNRQIKIEEAKANLEAEKLMLKQRWRELRVQPRLLLLRMEQSPLHIFSTFGCASRTMQPIR